MLNDSFLQMTFDKLVSFERVEIVRNNRNQYNSFRVMLVQKLTKYKQDMDSIGFLSDAIKDSTLVSSFNAEKCIATFELGAPRPKTTYVLVSSEPIHGNV